MSNKVDNLFSDLKEHSIPPSAEAWKKVETNLSKKNNRIIWIRIAAGIILLGAGALISLKMTSTETSTPQIVKQEEKPVSTPPTEQNLNQKEAVENPITSVAETKSTASIKKHVSRLPKEKQNKQQEPVQNEMITEPEIISETVAAVIEKTEIVTPVTTQKKSITLVFNLPTISAPDITNTVAQANPTALEKAMETANEIRNGDALGSLREFKNELFAFDFKKDKSKKQQ